MKKSLAIFSILVWALSMSAQTSINPPRWMKRLPKAPARAMYVYKVTSGEAYTYEEAYSKAFAKAILEYAGKADQMELHPILSKDELRPAYSVLDNMMMRLTGMEEPKEWKAALKEYLDETGGIE